VDQWLEAYPTGNELMDVGSVKSDKGWTTIWKQKFWRTVKISWFTGYDSRIYENMYISRPLVTWFYFQKARVFKTASCNMSSCMRLMFLFDEVTTFRIYSGFVKCTLFLFFSLYQYWKILQEHSQVANSWLVVLVSFWYHRD